MTNRQSEAAIRHRRRQKWYKRLGLGVRNRETRPDRQRRKLVNRVATRTPSASSSSSRRSGILGCHFAGVGPDDDARVEPTTVDAHRAPEAAADLECRLEDCVPGSRGGTAA